MEDEYENELNLKSSLISLGNPKEHKESNEKKGCC